MKAKIETQCPKKDAAFSSCVTRMSATTLPAATLARQQEKKSETLPLAGFLAR